MLNHCKSISLKNIFLLLSLVFSIYCCDDTTNPVDPTPMMETGFEGYTLVWSDEFDDNVISNVNWVHEIGDGTAYGLPAGWGNNEIQLYTDSAENSSIEMDGDVSALTITVTEDGTNNYNSAKLTTEGLQSFRYGKIDARIKLPTGQGMWPAFWLLGENRPEIDWPGCGEIDVVELVGNQPNVAHANVHFTNGNNDYSNDEGSPQVISETFDQDYHNFGIDWSPTEIQFSLDGEVYKTTSLSDDMKEFQRSFYLILNVAVGGPWAGDPDASTSFPQKMYVDYIRYYSQDGFTPDGPPELIIEEETVGTFVPPTIAQFAFNSTELQFPGIEVKFFGAGGEPVITASDTGIEGDSSLLFSYPGGTWGGGWFEMTTPLDFTDYANGKLIFSLQMPDDLANAEIKLESVTNSASVFLIDYNPIEISDGFVEYSIPLTDFIDLDFTEIRIPFALWNPVNNEEAFTAFDVIVDNIYWEQ